MSVEGQLVAAVIELREAVGALWRRGWQPVDVGRAMGRQGELAAGQGPALSDAMVDELRRYAPATVDQRWAAQLRDLRASVWWPADTDYARARTGRGEDPDQVLQLVKSLLAWVRWLPAIEPLGPAPGAARPTGGETGGGEAAGEVDPRVLERVRAFLAKAESTPYPEEAETFTEAAQRLMTRHRIDEALLAAADPSRRAGTVGRRIGIEAPYERAKVQLVGAVAEANGCRAVWSRTLGHCTLVGFPADLAVVETVFTSLLVQATSAMRVAGKGAAHNRTRGFRSSFLTAFAGRIAERLSEVDESETQAADRTAVESGTGSSGELVRVMAERDAEVDRSTAAMFPRLRSQRRASVSDPTGWYSGRAAADHASLATGSPLEGRS